MFKRSPNRALWLSAPGKLAAKKVSPGATSERDNRKQQQKVTIKSDNSVALEGGCRKWPWHMTIEGDYRQDVRIIVTARDQSRFCEGDLHMICYWHDSPTISPLMREIE
jgi:hypothetical protein